MEAVETQERPSLIRKLDLALIPTSLWRAWLRQGRGERIEDSYGDADRMDLGEIIYIADRSLTFLGATALEALRVGVYLSPILIKYFSSQ